MIDNFMQQLQKDLELPELGPTMPGVYSLPLEEDVAITIASQPIGFVLSCKCAPCPKEREDIFYTRMLLGNLFGQGTKGATLGLDEEGKTLILTRQVDHSVDYKDFRDILEDFINIVDLWREETKNHK